MMLGDDLQKNTNDLLIRTRGKLAENGHSEVFAETKENNRDKTSHYEDFAHSEPRPGSRFSHGVQQDQKLEREKTYRSEYLDIINLIVPLRLEETRHNLSATIIKHACVSVISKGSSDVANLQGKKYLMKRGIP